MQPIKIKINKKTSWEIKMSWTFKNRQITT